MCLVGISQASHSLLPICGALIIATYALAIPLRLASLLLSREFLRFAWRMAIRVIALLASVWAVSVAVNSHVALLAALGNTLFAALVLLVALVALRAVWGTAVSAVPVLATTSGSALRSVRARAELFSVYLFYSPAR